MTAPTADTRKSTHRPATGGLMLFAAAALVGFGLSSQPAAAHSAAVFAAFPAKDRFRGKPRRPNFQGVFVPRVYKRAIIRAARRGPNFAGAYTVATFGCGTGCQAVLVISAKTGRIYKAPEAATHGVTFRRNSRFLVFNADPVHRFRARFFVFERGRFREIRRAR